MLYNYVLTGLVNCAKPSEMGCPPTHLISFGDPPNGS